MRLEHGRRASLALGLNLLAFAFALSAVTTSYWCEGTSNINDSRLVQYIFETGEEKFLLRKFHTGIFFSCEQAADMNGKSIEIAPEHERGVLWLCIVAESLYLALLFAGGALMTLEQCPCFSLMNRLKLSAFAALCTALSGLCGMVAHMMFTPIFQLAVAMGPEDWRPKTWDTAGLRVSTPPASPSPSPPASPPPSLPPPVSPPPPPSPPPFTTTSMSTSLP
uniref:Gsg1-like 2a n=1 Tax=Salarias fasciatus TaxID=181472 RepID=A0A672HVL3_SALFA